MTPEPARFERPRGRLRWGSVATGIGRPRRGAAKKSPKRRLFELHSWLGFHLALIMSIVLATGTLAVLAHEIDWLIQSDMRVSPGVEKVSWGDMESAVREAAPDDVLSVLQRGEADYMAYRAVMLRPDGSLYFMHVNQWTGEVTGTSHRLTVQRFLRDIHRYLFMPSVISLPLVCSMGFVLLVSLYTGLKTVGRMRTVATRVRSGKGVRVLVGDAHKAVGIWSIWFLLLMAVTGIWYLVEFGGQLAGQSFEPPRLGPSQAQLEQRADILPRMDADEIVALAQIAYPELAVTQLLFPTRPDRPVMVWGKVGDPLLRDRANRVSLDPYDGSVVQVVRSNESGWVAYLNDIADPLHFGNFGYLTTKLIWFVFGVVLTGLSFSGVWLTYRRLKAVVVSRTQLATLPVLIAVFVFGYMYVDDLLQRPPAREVLATFEGEVGPFCARLTLEQVAEGDARFLRLLLTHEDGLPLLRSAAVSIGAADAVDLEPVFFASGIHLEAPVMMQGDLPALGISVQIESNRGLEYEAVLGSEAAARALAAF